MKTLCLMFAVSFGVAFAAAPASSSPVPTDPAKTPRICPPNEYDCCDGDGGTARYCAAHGGTCGIRTRCGVPV
jgi:hypothetical protein